MVHIDNDLAPHVPRSSSGKVPADAKIEFSKPIPKSLQSKTVNSKVIEKYSNGHYKLQLKDGQTLQAKITPAPKIGSPISFISMKSGENKITAMVVDNFSKETSDKKQQDMGSNQQKQAGGKQLGDLLTQGKNTAPNSKLTLLAENKPQLTDALLKSSATNVAEVHKDDPFKQLRPLIGQKVALTLPKGQVLANANGVVTVVVSKPDNGLQTLQPQNNALLTITASDGALKNIPPFQAKFPTVVPTGTVIKMNIVSGKGEILDITPPKNVAVLATKEVVLPQVSSTQAQSIILSTKITGFEKNLPIGAELTIKTISGAVKQPDLIETKTLTLGEVKTTALAQFTHKAVTSGGIKLSLTSQTNIAEGSEMTIKIDKTGGVQVIKVNNETATGSRHSAQTFIQPKGQQEHHQQQSQLPFKPGSQHSGTVTEQKGDGKITLSFADGKIIDVKAKTAIPIGAKVTVMIAEDGVPEIIQTQIPQTVSQAITLTHMANKWSTLLKSLNALKYASPSDGQQLKNNLPNLEKETFLPNLISFIDAVNTKSMKRLAGEETLNLLKALGIDFSADIKNLQATTQKNSEQPESWRALLFPYLEGEDADPRQGGFFWHNQEDEDGHAENTRFIVHLELTAMGAIQIDGLVQKSDIQLKLSTGTPLEEEHVQGIKSVVRQTLEKLDMTGDIHIKKEQAHAEKPLSLIVNKAHQYKVTI
ncbi:MAG: hypothetical protein ACI9TY_000100 [Alphaproteobacteria bacterium]|jgi:hypothetical protein